MSIKRNEVRNLRQKKAFLNSSINIITFVIIFLPNLFLQKLFIQILGEDIRGLNGLYSSIIGWLSIMDLGIGTAIVFSLYKPFAEKDYSRVRAYLNFYKKFYITIGCMIGILGAVIIPFLPFFVGNNNLDKNTIYIGFLLYLLNSIITYFFSSQLCIVIVAQDDFKITLGTTISKLITMIIQIILLYVYPNFIIFIFIQLIINLLYYIIINLYTLKSYPWIKNNKDYLEREEKNFLIRNVRAMFAHRIGSLLVFGTDSIVISKFLGLSTLGLYSNYQLIINGAQSLVGSLLHGLTSSIGNLLVDKNAHYVSNIHKKIFFLNFWITSFMTISLFNTLNQFIAIFFGAQYLIDNLTFIVIIINFYFLLMRGSIERFKEASGNYYQDRYAPLIEGIVNLVVSLILVKYIGLAGVFIGTLVSNFTVLFWVQPHIVYKYVFHQKLSNYIIMYFKYLVLFISILIISDLLVKPFKIQYNILCFSLNCLINIIFINVAYIIIFYKTDNFKYCYSMIKTIFNK